MILFYCFYTVTSAARHESGPDGHQPPSLLPRYYAGRLSFHPITIRRGGQDTPASLKRCGHRVSCDMQFRKLGPRVTESACAMMYASCVHGAGYCASATSTTIPDAVGHPSPQKLCKARQAPPAASYAASTNTQLMRISLPAAKLNDLAGKEVVANNKCKDSLAYQRNLVNPADWVRSHARSALGLE